MVCLPYLFEGIFPYLKNQHITNLRAGLSYENTMHQEEIQGKDANWMPCVRHFINAEYTEKVEYILNKVDKLGVENDYSLCLETYLKMAVNLSANNQKSEADKYQELFINSLHELMIEKIHVDVFDGSSINIYYNYESSGSGARYNPPDSVKKVFEILVKFCETRKNAVNSGENNFQLMHEKVSKINNYLNPLVEREIPLKNYMSLRVDKMPQDDWFKNEVNSDHFSDEFRNKLKLTILEIETSILEEIVGRNNI